MRAVVYRQALPIAPFGVLPDACPLGPSTFGAYRAATLRALSLPEVDLVDDIEVEGPAVVLADDVWVTKRALRAFLGVVKAASEPVRLAMAPSECQRMLAPLQDVDSDDDGRRAFSVAFVPGGKRARPSALFSLPASAWVTIPFREILIETRAPRFILGRESETVMAPVTSTVVMRIRHWLHLLRASHMAPAVFLVEAASAHPLRSAWIALQSLRLSKDAMLRAARRHAVYCGRNVSIHPSAVVEASVIGDDVSIGPHASVIGSVVGNGCYIEDRAHVNVSTLGPKTVVSRNSSMSATVTFGDTDACANGIQACVIGPRVGLTSFARPLDIVPGGEVMVMDDGEKRSVGPLPCGVAFGPDTFVGAGVTIAAGRSIPAGTRVLQDGANILRRIGDSAAHQTVRVVDGRAVSVDDEGNLAE